MILTMFTNPYSNRWPVTDPTSYYGRRTELLQVASSIREWEPLSITGEPRIGKSSFLYYLAHPDWENKQADFSSHLGNPTAYLFVTIELQLLPVRFAEEFWKYLFHRLVQETEKAGIYNEKLQAMHHLSQEAGAGVYQIQIILEKYLDQLERKVLFLFDDFDILIKDFENPEVTHITGVLRALKSSSLKDKMNYIIISTDSLSRLFEDKGIASSLSPLANIVVPAPPLGLLEEEAVHELLQKPFDQYPEALPRFSDEEKSFIVKLAGRHPDALKIACFYLLEAKIHGSVDFDRVRQTIEHDERLQWLMKRLWERATQYQELPLQDNLRQVALGQRPTNRRAFDELCRRGLVEMDCAGTPRVFSELFQTFVLHPQKAHAALPTSTSIAAFSGNLTPLEEKLYNFLTAHIEQVCTREQLQQVIWGDKLPASPDALEQLVKRLRAKLRRPASLLNVRGQGYLLRKPPIV